jgi:hypothetical protein
MQYLSDKLPLFESNTSDVHVTGRISRFEGLTAYLL